MAESWLSWREGQCRLRPARDAPLHCKRERPHAVFMQCQLLTVPVGTAQWCAGAFLRDVAAVLPVCLPAHTVTNNLISFPYENSQLSSARETLPSPPPSHPVSGLADSSPAMLAEGAGMGLRWCRVTVFQPMAFSGASAPVPSPHVST